MTKLKRAVQALDVIQSRTDPAPCLHLWEMWADCFEDLSDPGSLPSWVLVQFVLAPFLDDLVEAVGAEIDHPRPRARDCSCVSGCQALRDRGLSGHWGREVDVKKEMLAFSALRREDAALETPDAGE